MKLRLKSEKDVIRIELCVRSSNRSSSDYVVLRGQRSCMTTVSMAA